MSSGLSTTWEEQVAAVSLSLRAARFEYASLHHSSGGGGDGGGEPIAPLGDRLLPLLHERIRLYLDRAKQLLGQTSEEGDRARDFGLDPVTLHELALRDAKEVIELGDALGGNVLAAEAALFCDAAVAREHALAALAIDPAHPVAQRIASETNSRRPTKLPDTLSVDDLCCTVCFGIFIDPVTTGCGHSFCRQCLGDAIDYSSQTIRGQTCPLCRAPLFMDRYRHPTTVVLQNLIRNHFANELEEQLRLRQSSSNGDAGGAPTSLVLPVFILFCALPLDVVELNIFEPRYRLMMRRCLQGSMRFCMASSVDRRDSGPPLGVIVKIVYSDVQPDGRILISGIAEDPVELVNIGEQEGYVVAGTRKLAPVPLSDDERSEASAILSTIANRVRRHTNETLPPDDHVEELCDWLSTRCVPQGHRELREKLLRERSALRRARLLDEASNGAQCLVS